MKYRKKPVVVEAVQWVGQATEELPEWCDEAADLCESPEGCYLSIETSDGFVRCGNGDWLIKGFKSVYVLKPDDFEATYEADTTDVVVSCWSTTDLVRDALNDPEVP